MVQKLPQQMTQLFSVRHLWAASLVLAASTLAACGNDDAERKDAKGSTGSSLTEDATLNQQAVGSIMTDAFDSLSDQGTTAASLNLSSDSSADAVVNEVGDKATDQESKFEKSCSVEDGKAVVAVSSDIKRVFERTGRNVSFSRTLTGKSEQKRVFAKVNDGSAVAMECNANGKSAKVDWKAADLAGLSLEMTFSREREIKGSFTNKRKNTTREWERSFKAEGSRSVSWGEIDASASNTTDLVREKTVTSKVKRTFNGKNKAGEDVSMELDVETKDGAPLVISVTRNATSLAIKEKKIKSGTLIGKKAGDGSVETSFENLHIIYGSGLCSAKSGVVTSKVFKDGSTDAVRELKLTIVDGEYTMVDVASGEEVSDFEFDACDPEDLAL